MRLASFRTSNVASFGAVTDRGIVDLGARIGNQYADLKSLIARGAPGEIDRYLKNPPDFKESEVSWLPVIPNPGKIVCVGLNYEEHRPETGRDKTENPALSLRVPEPQVGPARPTSNPRGAARLDFEAEL